MMHAATDAELASQVFVKLSDEAWQQLASRPFAALSLTDIAGRVEVDDGLAKAVAGDLQQLVLGKIAALDSQAVTESFADIKDAGKISIREKILEALMHRYEVYSPFRTQIKSLTIAARRQPDLGIGLGISLHNVTKRILVMAGDNCQGLRGLLRIKGVIGLVVFTSRVWMRDESSDLASTMKELDQRLLRAEEWAVSLNLLRQNERDIVFD